MINEILDVMGVFNDEISVVEGFEKKFFQDSFCQKKIKILKKLCLVWV